MKRVGRNNSNNLKFILLIFVVHCSDGGLGFLFMSGYEERWSNFIEEVVREKTVARSGR